MLQVCFIRFLSLLSAGSLIFFALGCQNNSENKFYGKTVAPSEDVLKYVSGSEPESLDPQIPTGQPEARVLMALYDGLVEYHPKTAEPMPAIAESWETGKDGTEYLFNLRKNAKFSNGEAITAKDFVNTFRRAMSPELAAQNAYLGFYIKYSEAYNSGKVFLKDDSGNFFLRKDFLSEEELAIATQPTKEPLGKETEFQKFLNSEDRLTLEGTPFELSRAIEGDDKKKAIFKVKPSNFKNIGQIVSKIKNGTDGTSKMLQEKLGASLDKCANDCDADSKQAIADGLNKLLAEEGWQTPERLQGLTVSPEAQKILKKFDDANKKVETDNKALDEEIAKLTDPNEKQEKEKRRKKPIAKLFYVNHFLMQDYFGENFEKPPFVPVKAEDIGVEAVDDYTVRLKLSQPAPFFLGLLPHQFFRVVHLPTVEKYGKDWVKPKNIVTSGAYKLKTHHPYDKVIVEKDPNYWDAANVKLNRIEFYPLEEATTMMNLYKAGELYATYNHTPPAAWNEYIKGYKDEYLNLPEIANEYYTFNVKKAPMDNPKIRQAFSYAVDREALSKFRKTTKPLYNFVPEGILPKYDEARNKVFAEEMKKNNISPEDWKKRIFNPEKARQLLAEAGYPVTKQGDRWVCANFPVEKVSITYNTAESNKAVAEFMQAQWLQNLGIQVPLKNMEWKTFLPVRKALDYQGMARAGWVGDYMDPATFLNLFYHEDNDSSTGWHKPEYDKILDNANKELDEQKRLEMLATAEFMILKEQTVIPMQTQATNWIKKPFVKGFYPNPVTLHAWKFVYIERDPTKWDTDVENILQVSDPRVDEQVKQLMSTQKNFEAAKNELAKNAQTK